MIRYLILFAIIGLHFNACFCKIGTSTKSTPSTNSTPTTKSIPSTKSTPTTKSTPSTKSTPTTKSTPKSTSTIKSKLTTIKTTSVPHSTLKSDEWIDPAIGGKYGNPGATFHMSNKSIDAVHKFAADVIVRAIREMVISDFAVPIGMGILTVKAPRVSEASFANVDYQYLPPNRIQTSFTNGKFVANGDWQWQMGGSVMNGTYKATVVNGELEPIIQLGRSYDAKPTAQMVQCNANLSQFRVDVNGAGNLTSVQNCNNPVCTKIRQFFESSICELAKKFTQEVINRELAKYPARMSICSQYQLDYGLQSNEPKVTNDDIEAGLEGKVLYRGYGSVPFYPQELIWIPNNDRMVSLQLSDFTFNTLLHQTHSSGYQYSAADLLSSYPMIQDLLKLNCSIPAPATRKNKNLRLSAASRHAGHGNCLGYILENITNVGQYGPNDTGDLVFKSNRKAPSVAILSAQHGYFDASNGVLEVYGPQQSVTGGKRQLLAKADIQVMRGEFNPKLNATNITGTIGITTLQLSPPQPSRSLVDLSLEKLANFAMPILMDMFNAFFQQYAQFPVPLPTGYECSMPQIKINSHTIQLDCDVKVMQQSRMNCNCRLGRCSCGDSG